MVWMNQSSCGPLTIPDSEFVSWAQKEAALDCQDWSPSRAALASEGIFRRFLISSLYPSRRSIPNRPVPRYKILHIFYRTHRKSKVSAKSIPSILVRKWRNHRLYRRRSVFTWSNDADFASEGSSSTESHRKVPTDDDFIWSKQDARRRVIQYRETRLYQVRFIN